MYIRMYTIPTRYDFIFSYFLFIWFLFYYFGYIKYCPNSWLILGVIDNIIALALMVYYNNPILNILVFSTINIFIKLIPLWLIRNRPFRIQDFIFGSILFVIFSFWLSLYNTNFVKVTQNIVDSIKEKRAGTPLEYNIIKAIQYSWLSK